MSRTHAAGKRLRIIGDAAPCLDHSGAFPVGMMLPDCVRSALAGLIATLARDRSLSIRTTLPVIPVSVRNVCVPSAATEFRMVTPLPFERLLAGWHCGPELTLRRHIEMCLALRRLT